MYSYLFLSTSSCVSCHWLLINFLWIVSLTFFMRAWLLDLTADQILINSWLKDSQSDSGELWVQMSLGFPKEYPEEARDKGSSLFIRLSPAVKISQKSKLKAKNVNASVDFLGWSLRRFLVCTVRGWYNCSYYKDSNCVPFFFFKFIKTHVLYHFGKLVMNSISGKNKEKNERKLIISFL